MDEVVNNDMQQMEDNYEPDIITLVDEDSKEYVFEVLDAVDVDGHRYLALMPCGNKEGEEGTMIVMRVCENDDEESLDLVDDEDELFCVMQVFLNRMEELYEIDMDELEKGI